MGKESKRRLKAAYRPDRDSLRKLVASVPSPSNALGLTHVTTGYILREALDQGKLVAIDKCPVLNEPVIYAFYGRTAFRGKHDHIPSDLAFIFPTVCILDPSATPAPKYVFGFDSGAFMAGYMDGCLEQHMPLFDFHLEPDVTTAARLVELFFGSSNAFLSNQPRADLEIPASNFEAVSYRKMIIAGAYSSNRLDDRVSTPELVFDKPIELTTAAIKAVIMPDVLCVEGEIGGRLSQLGIRAEDYEWSGATRPSEYHALIRNRVRSIYKEFGWL